MKKFLPRLFVIVLFALSGACSTPKQPGISIPTQEMPYIPPPTVQPPPANTSAYPGPQVTSYLSLIPTSGPIPTPGADWGVVTGRLLENGKPALGGILYLAEVTKDAQGVERVAAYSQISSPKSYIDIEGYFIFPKVTPGKYSLILDTVISAYLLHKPGTQEQILFVVEAGKTTDLGDLNYDDLPIPEFKQP